MKRTHLFLASALFAAFTIALSTASAAELTLTDGRTFHDATIVSQSPRKVVIQHVDGLSGVEKSLLPADLAARYPIDEAAALEAERRSAEARAHANAFHKAEAERAALIRLEREQTALANARLAALEASNRLAEAEAARIARQRTETVYEYVPFHRSSPHYVHFSHHTNDCTPRWNNRHPHRDSRSNHDRHNHAQRNGTSDAECRDPRSHIHRHDTASRSQHHRSSSSQSQRTDDERRHPQKIPGSLARR